MAQYQVSVILREEFIHSGYLSYCLQKNAGVPGPQIKKYLATNPSVELGFQIPNGIGYLNAHLEFKSDLESRIRMNVIRIQTNLKFSEFRLAQRNIHGNIVGVTSSIGVHTLEGLEATFTLHEEAVDVTLRFGYVEGTVYKTESSTA